MNRKCDVLIKRGAIGEINIYADKNIWEKRIGYEVSGSNKYGFYLSVDPRYTESDALDSVKRIAANYGWTVQVDGDTATKTYDDISVFVWKNDETGEVNIIDYLYPRSKLGEVLRAGKVPHISCGTYLDLGSGRYKVRLGVGISPKLASESIAARLRSLGYAVEL